jgi:hypothetical protein
MMLAMRRAQTPGERMESGFRMTEFVQSLEIGVMRQRNPGVAEEELRYLLARKRYGVELAEKVFGVRSR